MASGEAADEVDTADLVAIVTESMSRTLFSGGDGGQPYTTPTIYRVTSDIRSVDNDAYDPKVISIGPYHHRKRELEQMESLKWSYLRDLIGRSSLGEAQLQRYVAALWRHEKGARGQYYDRAADVCSRDFVEILVLDGGFLVELFIKRASGRIVGAMTAASWNLPLLRRDLLLLENQIPFFVLQVLFDATDFLERNPDSTCTSHGEYYSDVGGYNGISRPLSPPPHRIRINQFGRRCTLSDLAIYYISNRNERKMPEDFPEPCHLLHLSHMWLLRDFMRPATVVVGHSGRDERPLFTKLRTRLAAAASSYLMTLAYFFVSLLLMCRPPRRNLTRPTNCPKMVPCAKELRDVNVRFSKKEGNHCILDVTFKGGNLEMPPQVIQDITNPYYRNLIALEHCCIDVTDTHFTSFAVFMDNIVDTAADVAILKEHKIIESRLGSDELVAKFFNKLAKGVILFSRKNYLHKLYEDVNKHYDQDWHKWRAKLRSDYFSNPWSMASFIAASMLLVMSFVQTMFSVVSYVHPQK